MAPTEHKLPIHVKCGMRSSNSYSPEIYLLIGELAITGNC